jgi:hypothetical protein
MFKFIYETWYFKHNKLVFASLRLDGGEHGMNTIYTRYEYYNLGKVTEKKTEKSKESEKYLYKTNVVLYNEGMKYLEDFEKGK